MSLMTLKKLCALTSLEAMVSAAVGLMTVPGEVVRLAPLAYSYHYDITFLPSLPNRPGGGTVSGTWAGTALAQSGEETSNCLRLQPQSQFLTPNSLRYSPAPNAGSRTWHGDTTQTAISRSSRWKPSISPRDFARLIRQTLKASRT